MQDWLSSHKYWIFTAGEEILALTVAQYGGLASHGLADSLGEDSGVPPGGCLHRAQACLDGDSPPGRVDQPVAGHTPEVILAARVERCDIRSS